MAIARTARTRNYRPAFTLVELVIVVLILGILSSVAAPRIVDTSIRAKQNTFAKQMQMFADAFDLYKANYGVHPNNSAPGTLPAGMDEFLRPSDFAKQTPLKGVWDYQAVGAGNSAAIVVEYANGVDWPGDAVMQQVDALLDDGNLSLGSFRKLEATHKWVYYQFGPD